MLRPRLFSSHLTRTQRRVYGAVLVFYLFAFFAMVPPVFSPFNKARPLVLGMPLSLFYLAAFIISSFLVLLAMFLWEGRRDDEPPGGDD
jgi:hypothetical protein